ncbi:MAG: AzlC family ABC transporter permease [Pseudomonadota bacterium]
MPFGALFGALAVENGMSVFEATLMSATVFAGASQMVGIDLFGAQIAPWLIVFSIFAVNFRHVLYSAVTGQRMAQFKPWQRYVSFFFLVDPHFAESEHRAERGVPLTFAWFIGGGLTWWVVWVFVSYLGALFGSLIEEPENYGFDLLLPIYFLSLVLAFRKRANWLPVVAASGIVAVLAFHFVGSPWHVSLGGLAGVAVAAIIGLPKNHRMVV